MTTLRYLPTAVNFYNLSGKIRQLPEEDNKIFLPFQERDNTITVNDNVVTLYQPTLVFFRLRNAIKLINKSHDYMNPDPDRYRVFKIFEVHPTVTELSGTAWQWDLIQRLEFKPNNVDVITQFRFGSLVPVVEMNSWERTITIHGDLYP